MKIKAEHIIKNFASISVGQFFNLFINLIGFALIARFLVVEDFGIFSTYIAILGIVSKIVDLGLSPIVFRESSKNNDYFLINTSISLRLVVFVVISVIANLIIIIWDYQIDRFIIINLLLINIIISSRLANIRDLLTIPFKVNLSMHIPTILSIIDNLLFLLFVLLIPSFENKIVSLTIIYVVSNVPGFIIQLLILYKKYNFRISFNLKKVRWLLKESFPIWGFVTFMMIFQQIDLLLIKEIVGAYSAGIFAVALRIILPLNIIPTAMVTTVFPLIVRKEFNNKKIESLIFKLLIYISFFIFISFHFKGEEFITIVFSEKYSEASLVTSILLFSQIFLFINFFATSLFTINLKQFWNMIYSLLLIIVNISIAIPLIKNYSFLGGGVAMLLSVIVGFLFILYVKRKVGVKYSIITFNKILFLMLVGVLSFFSSFLPIYFYIILQIFIFLLVAFSSQYFNRDEKNIIFNLVKKKIL